jgi:hypothetical protein
VRGRIREERVRIGAVHTSIESMGNKKAASLRLRILTWKRSR